MHVLNKILFKYFYQNQAELITEIHYTTHRNISPYSANLKIIFKKHHYILKDR